MFSTHTGLGILTSELAVRVKALQQTVGDIAALHMPKLPAVISTRTMHVNTKDTATTIHPPDGSKAVVVDLPLSSNHQRFITKLSNAAAITTATTTRTTRRNVMTWMHRQPKGIYGTPGTINMVRNVLQLGPEKPYSASTPSVSQSRSYSSPHSRTLINPLVATHRIISGRKHHYNKSTIGGARWLFGFGSRNTDQQLERLLDQAEDQPTNPRKQAVLYQYLSDESPEEVVRRYESGIYAADRDCLRWYIHSLVHSNRLNNEALARILETNGESEDGYGEDYSHTSGFTSGGTEDSPMVVTIKEPGFKGQMWRLLRSLLVLLIVITALNQMIDERGMGKGMANFSEIKPEETGQEYSFEDVQGVDEAKEELQDVVAFLDRPEEFTRLGGKLPKGVLLMGPPGTGKTLLARAVAGEAGVPFFYCSGSEFDEMFVGVGARRVRELFAAAKRKSPAIIFIDEIDAMGGKRSTRDQQFTRMTLNQILVEMDGFDQNDGVVVIAATNFPEMLDPALTRPGRFDTHVRVPLPDLRGRQKILQTHSRKVPLEDPDDLKLIARGTPGFSGADLANLVNSAALRASQLRKDTVTIDILEWAKDKILMGVERKDAAISEVDRKLTAYHEGGHALCALYTDGATPVYKATIVPRGQSLGMVTQLPEGDTNSVTRKEMMARMVVCMGGRAAEERVFGKENVTSGASSDVEQATKIARAMVYQYGMSEKIGPVLYTDDDTISDSTRKLLESEVQKLLNEALQRSHNLLSRHEKEHHRLAEALLERETLTAAEMRLVCAGKKLPPI